MTKQDAFRELRVRLADLFDARFAGVETARYAAAQGFADGYMRALEDMGLASGRELLGVVHEERHRAARRADLGPASLPAPNQALPDFA